MFNNIFSKESGFGFTIVELMIAITVLSLLTPIVVFNFGNYFQDNITSLATTTQDTDTQTALGAIATDLRVATGYRASLGVAGVTPLGSDSGATGNVDWSYCGTAVTGTTCDGVTTNDYVTSRVLIAYNFLTDGPADRTTRMPIFINDGSSFSQATSTPATYAFVYFVAPDRANSSKNNLYRRTIVDVNTTTNVFRNVSASTGLWSCATSNPSPTVCATPYQKTSCASTMVTSHSSTCLVSDAVLLYDVKSFWVDYYDSSNNKIANYYSSNATNAAAAASDIQNLATSVVVTVSKQLPNMSKKASTLSLKILRQW